MRHFHYTGRQEQGATIEGWVIAQDRDDALLQLRRRGIAPFSVRIGAGHIPLKVSLSELLVSLKELASLRKGGMAIDEAVKTVMDTTDNRVLQRSWNQVLQMLRSGLSLSEAFGAIPDTFPRYSVPLVRLGEANGTLAQAIELIAERMDEESRLKGEIRSAVTYPGFLLVVCTAVLIFIFTIVIPKFGDMVTGGSGISSSSMEVLLGISIFLREYAWLWVLTIVAVVSIFLYNWKSGNIQALIWSIVEKLPGFKSMIENWEVVQFCSSMARLLPGGVALLEAFSLSSESLGREHTRQVLQNSADQIRQGRTLGEALESGNVFPKLVIQMIKVGERSGHLSTSMQEIAALYERRLRDGINRALSLLEPSVIIIMGIALGGIMISLLSAIITINDIPI